MYLKFVVLISVSLLALMVMPISDKLNAQSNKSTKKANTTKASSSKSTKSSQPSKGEGSATTTTKSRNNNLIIERQIKYKKGDKTEYDFDAADISGNLKTPLGSLVDSLNSNKDYDFIKVRLKWTPEMVQSASSLETGRGDK